MVGAAHTVQGLVTAERPVNRCQLRPSLPCIVKLMHSSTSFSFTFAHLLWCRYFPLSFRQSPFLLILLVFSHSGASTFRFPKLSVLHTRVRLLASVCQEYSIFWPCCTFLTYLCCMTSSTDSTHVVPFRCLVSICCCKHKSSSVLIA